MKTIFHIAKRDFSSYFNSLRGYLILALILLITGLLFNTISLGTEPKLSYDILASTGPRYFGFFWVIFGTTTIASIFISVGLIAEEKQLGTLVLLEGAEISETKIILGKWFAALLFSGVLLALSTFLPALVYVNGKLSFAHIATGYLGLLCVLSMTNAIGIFASTLTKSQVMAAVIASVIISFFLLSWVFAKTVDVPFRDFFSYLSIFDRHFGRTFAKGILSTRSMIYFASLTSFFLSLGAAALGSRKWT